jgi:hypothetical protein
MDRRFDVFRYDTGLRGASTRAVARGPARAVRTRPVGGQVLLQGCGATTPETPDAQEPASA